MSEEPADGQAAARDVLILTGAPGVGKSTIARAWARRRRGAIVECDYFTEWIFDTGFPHWTEEEERFTADLTAAVAMKYLAIGLPVAIENVWSPIGLDLLSRHFAGMASPVSCKTVWLTCSPEENRRRDALRPPEDQMLDRVMLVRDQLAGYNWPAFVHRLDSSGCSREETLQVILAL